MSNLFLKRKKKHYLSLKMDVEVSLDEDVITASSSIIGDEKFDVTEDAIPYD
jgi:hypothetical protein